MIDPNLKFDNNINDIVGEHTNYDDPDNYANDITTGNKDFLFKMSNSHD